MTKKTLAALGALALLGASCGGSSDEAMKIADNMMSSAKELGIELDESCVSELAEELNDADTKMLVDNLDNEDFDFGQLSPEGNAISSKMMGCADKEALIDDLVEQFGSIPGVDADCVRGALEEIEPEQLALFTVTQGLSSTEDLSAKMLACTTSS